MVFILYKLYFLFSVLLNLPLTGNFVHFYFLKKKTHSVLFINLLKNGDMGKCPHKSPSPCNTCHTHVFIQICVLICHKNTHTHTHTHTHAHTRTRARTLTHTHMHAHTCTHARTHVYTHTVTHTHTHKHTHTCWFLWFMGTLHRRNGFYTVQTVCAIALHLPYT